MVGRSKFKTKPEGVVYSFKGMPRIIYKIIKIFSFIVIIILLFYVILYKNSATNFQCRLLNETHDLLCSTFKVFYHHGGHHVA